MRIDLHIHTNHSPDSSVKPEELPKLAKRRGLDGVAVTDHSRFSAYKEVKAAAKGSGILVIPGEEIGVKPAGRRVGEIIGLFIEEEISGKGRTAVEVIDEIRRQGGVVVLPHPFDMLRDVFPEEQLNKIAGRVDAVEVFNSHVLIPSFNAKAKAFAERFKLAETGGSDSHTPWEIGNAWTEAKCEDLEGFRKALLKRRTKAGGSYVLPHMRVAVSLVNLKGKIRKKLGL